MAQRIGICRALHAFHHYALWQALFEGSELEVVLSGPTSRAEIEQGVKLAPAELCLPVKAFLGHVAALRDKVDALFLPRIVCRQIAGDRFFGCPKAIALPDLVRATFDTLPAIVEPILDEQMHSEERAYRKVLGGGGFRAAWQSAQGQAHVAFEATRRNSTPLGMFPEERRVVAAVAGNGKPVRVGVVGHPYLLFDDCLNLGLLDKLAKAGAQPIVVFPTPAEVEREAKGADEEKPEVGDERPERRKNEAGVCHRACPERNRGDANTRRGPGRVSDLGLLQYSVQRPTGPVKPRTPGPPAWTSGPALNWYYELELLAAARNLLESRRVDGLLLVASFACGTGAVTNELMHRKAVHEFGVPTVTLLLDEHSGEAGLVTRLESFVDLLRFRKA